MPILTLSEEMILVALCRLGGAAHGPALRARLVELTGKSIVYGTLYNSLENLIRKEYVASQRGCPTPERGGKAKSIYTIAAKGREALLETRKMREKLWSGLSDSSIEAEEPVK